MIFGQMPPASDSRTGHVSIIDIHNTLNIHFIGINALGNLFSVNFYEKGGQDEISRTILKIRLLNGRFDSCWVV